MNYIDVIIRTPYATVSALKSNQIKFVGAQIKKHRITRSNRNNKFKIPELENKVLHHWSTVGSIL